MNRLHLPFRPGLVLGSVQELRDHGALIKVRIAQPRDVADSLRAQGKAVADAVDAMAMIDTGASITAIDQGLATRIGLVQTGVAPVAGVTGVQDQPIYAAQVMLDQPSVALDPWKMIGSPLNIQNFDVLLGRDFLQELTLVYDGSSGNFQLSPGSVAGAQGGGSSSFVKWLGGAMGVGGVAAAVGFLTKIF